jgi:hypothetical protein
LFGAFFHLMRGDRGRTAANGALLAQLAGEHDLDMWRAFAAFFAWGDRPLESMRRGLELLRAQNVRIYDGLRSLRSSPRVRGLRRSSSNSPSYLAEVPLTDHRAQKLVGQRMTLENQITGLVVSSPLMTRRLASRNWTA